MKIRFLIPLLFSFVLFLSCSQDNENYFDNDVQNLSQTNTPGGQEGSTCACQMDWQAPTKSSAPGYNEILVTYDSSLGDDEKHCIRYEYMECNFKGWLFLNADPSSDPTTESWLVAIGKPNGDVLNDICNDPMTNAPECDD